MAEGGVSTLDGVPLVEATDEVVIGAMSQGATRTDIGAEAMKSLSASMPGGIGLMRRCTSVKEYERRGNETHV